MCFIPGCHMAAGTVYTDCLTTQHTWKTMNRWRGTLNDEFRLFTRKEARQHKAGALQHVDGPTQGRRWVQPRAFWANCLPPIPHPHFLLALLNVCGEWAQMGSMCSVYLSSRAAWLYGWLIYWYEEKSRTQANVHTRTPFQEFCEEGLTITIWHTSAEARSKHETRCTDRRVRGLQGLSHGPKLYFYMSLIESDRMKKVEQELTTATMR